MDGHQLHRIRMFILIIRIREQGDLLQVGAQ